MPKPVAAPHLILALAIGLGLAIGLAAPAAPDALAQPQTQSYVVQKGDTIYTIAREFYGKSSLGPALWRANRELVAHPRRLTPGDTIYIFPETTLALKRPIQVPPEPMENPVTLYEAPQPLQMAFPKYFSYLADPRGQGGTGVTRLRVKKKVLVLDETGKPVQGTRRYPALDENNEVALDENRRPIYHEEEVDVYQDSDELYEVHLVGEIVGSSDRGAPYPGDYGDRSAPGRMLLSTGDNVIVRFVQDVAKLRDSDTYEDPDPYFTTFPVYAVNASVRETESLRPDFGQNMGQIFRYKGRVTVVARVEGIAPPSASATSRAVRRQRGGNAMGQDLEPVTYVARITYSEDAINLNDKVMLFIPADPGPERRLDAPHVEDPATYASPGK
jgi:hypothetical protein